MLGFPGGACQCRRCKSRQFDPWVAKVGSLEWKMATRSSILAWEVPWMEDPGGPQAVESQRIRQDCECICVHPQFRIYASPPTLASFYFLFLVFFACFLNCSCNLVLI